MRRWTEEEDNFIKDNYLIMSAKDIASTLNRSVQVIHTRASRLNCTKNNSNNYTPEIDDFILKNSKTMSNKEIADYFGLLEHNIVYRKKVIGCDVNKGSKKYTDEMDVFLKENIKNYTIPELVELLNKKFNINVNLNGVTQHLQAIGVYRELSYNERSQLHHTKLTKYNLNDEIIKHGFVMVKVKNDIHANHKNWKEKHHLVWEKSIGEIPNNYSFGFLDGDTTNCDINNLYIYPKKWSVFLNQSLCKKDSNPQIKITALMCCQLHYGCKDNFYLGKEAINEK